MLGERLNIELYPYWINPIRIGFAKRSAGDGSFPSRASGADNSNTRNESQRNNQWKSWTGAGTSRQSTSLIKGASHLSLNISNTPAFLF
jgi:hypothetical protein